ncbi:hypothetical protein H072_7530 [Dactylellina haptotyla CBS 200.50]|uniref:Uncharacterized protein n=1 Tax=Dactylellina haptotyla (strain CBS 200.50) TaxID=1284197 RepID=S8A7B6_DACHA|nr:hypothetical protein H072_7530 [Dactylellina haptotyla CBS 200.50]
MSSRGGTTLYVTGFGQGTRARDLAYEFERFSFAYYGSRPIEPVEPSLSVVVVVVVVFVRRYRLPLLVSPLNLPSEAEISTVANKKKKKRVSNDSTFGFSFPTDTDVSSVATFLLHELQAADLTLPPLRFAFVEYESRRDADDAYFEMHGRRIGRDDILKIEWARTPPSASWRFDGGRDAPRRRSPGRRGGGSPRRSGAPRSASPARRADRSPNGRAARDRSRSPGAKEDRDRDGDREMRSPREERERERERDRDRESRRDERERERDQTPPRHDDLDTADAE